MSTATVVKPNLQKTLWWQRPWSFTLKCYAAAGAIATFSSLYLFFSSTVTVTPTDPLNSEALSSPFTINNTSQFFSLYQVQPSCIIKGENYKTVEVGFDVTSNYSAPIPEMGPGGYDTIYCQTPIHFVDPAGGKTLNADVVIAVTFRSFFHTKHRYFRFVTRTDSDGKVRWIYYGLMDQDPDFHDKP